ncbi:DUF3885 domain-containing protein [Sorangium sp. So ce542]|uniref:DUF3885 domain-containing protein n=1 Tax=Sorangium sp. So ce542 TaxID=3133316 RepID=UPI003F5D5ADB
MQMSQLSEVWRRHLDDSEPVAHLLRARFGDRWVRFHALPGSKRYPEDEEEMVMVLERHNRVIGSLAGEEGELSLLSTERSSSELPSKGELAHLFPGAQAWRSVAMHKLSGDWEEPTYWHVFSSVVQWSRGVLDGVLRLVADDRAANVMLLSARGWLYHPYDGGADVIAPTRDERDRLATEFSAWLSNHPLGL